MSRYRGYNRSVKESWLSQSISTRIIRLWLGLTWIYAGWDKASDPGFLTNGSPTFIGSQLSDYSTQSPIDFIFNKLIEYSVLVGVFVLLSELAIGIATLMWIAPTTAAFAGFSMAIGLWLASSFYVEPYFLASDTAYAVLWLAYFFMLLGKRRNVGLSLDRRGVMRAVAVGALAVIIAGFGKIFAVAKTIPQADGAATKIIKTAALAIGSTYGFALANGDTAIVFKTAKGVFAYSSICTHQGCTVAFNSESKTLQCPCHGSEFDPFSDAKVIGGPALTALPKISVAIEGDWIVLL